MIKTKNTKELQTEKAYKNLDFLNSKDARTLRILSEYLYPKKQLEEEKVTNTIVIFGSARAPSPEELSNKEDFNKGRSKSLKLAEYYDATRILSKRLTEWSKNLNQEDQKYVICSGGGPGIMIAANYKIPKQILLLEELPLLDIGKVDKKALRAFHDSS